MKFFAALALLVAAGANAQSSPTAAPGAQPTSDCAADFIVTRCIETEQSKVNDCGNNQNYACLCSAYQAILTCYNNCPHDSRQPAAKSQVDSFCNAASLVATHPTTAATTLSVASSSGPVATVSAPAHTSSAGSGSGSTPASKTTSAKTSTTTAADGKNAAAGLAANGLLAAAVGAVIAIL
ncbi:hypothetical protein PT974_11232 [Cladobotryum mycophilum]|uniref:Extracellular membrane protein CFEM domain-containing protein n=1 Tax=Cladobotryum mycophilum TaxID=491253 RepID=A0ABR0S4M3_9HYPO